MPILEAEGLVKTYGSRKVVDGVSFSVDVAEIVGLLGPNGAGKTTSFRITCGMIEPDRGQVILNGIDAVTIEIIQKIIRDLKARGISILITDHQYRETLDITDRSYIVAKGEVLCHGTPPEIVSNPKARELYFGTGLDAALSKMPP